MHKLHGTVAAWRNVKCAKLLKIHLEMQWVDLWTLTVA